MKKIFRHKFFVSGVLLILTFIAVFVLLPSLYESQSETMDVVQFVENVSMGTEITESMLTVKTIGAYGVANSGIITDKADIVGKYATQDIRRVSNLFVDMFSDTWADVNGAVDTLLEEGDVLVSITVPNLAASVGGMVGPGDYVNVMSAVLSSSSEVEYDEWGYPVTSVGGDYTVMEQTELLTNVMVYKVQNSEGGDITELERTYRAMKESGEEDDFDSSLIPSVVTLVVSPEQAIALANQELNGYVHFTLIPAVSQEMYDDLVAEYEAERAEMAIIAGLKKAANALDNVICFALYDDEGNMVIRTGKYSEDGASIVPDAEEEIPEGDVYITIYDEDGTMRIVEGNLDENGNVILPASEVKAPEGTGETAE